MSFFEIMKMDFAVCLDKLTFPSHVNWMQDYRVHKDEIHSKLVAIMKDRLLTVHLPTLSQTVETWNRPDDGDNQASPFAKGLTKVRE